jgi:hypothetical protein
MRIALAGVAGRFSGKASRALPDPKTCPTSDTSRPIACQGCQIAPGPPLSRGGTFQCLPVSNRLRSKLRRPSRSLSHADPRSFELPLIAGPPQVRRNANKLARKVLAGCNPSRPPIKRSRYGSAIILVSWGQVGSDGFLFRRGSGDGAFRAWSRSGRGQEHARAYDSEEVESCEFTASRHRFVLLTTQRTPTPFCAEEPFVWARVCSGPHTGQDEVHEEATTLYCRGDLAREFWRGIRTK